MGFKTPCPNLPSFGLLFLSPLTHFLSFLRPIPFYQGHGCSLSRLIRNWEASSSPDLEPLGFCHLCLLNWYKPCTPFFIYFNLSSVCLSFYRLIQIPSNLQSRSLFPFTTQAHLTSTHRGSRLKYRDPRSPRVLWVSAFSFLLLAWPARLWEFWALRI